MFPLGSLKRWSAESISVWTPYFKDEAEGDTVISVRITEQEEHLQGRNDHALHGSHTSHGKPGAGDFPPALDKGIDVLGAADEGLRTRLARDHWRKKPPVADAAADADEERDAVVRVAVRFQADER